MIDDKPIVQGPVSGNIAAIVAAASKAMKAATRKRVQEMQQRVIFSKNYDEALNIVQDYVDFELGGGDDAS